MDRKPIKQQQKPISAKVLNREVYSQGSQHTKHSSHLQVTYSGVCLETQIQVTPNTLFQHTNSFMKLL